MRWTKTKTRLGKTKGDGAYIGDDERWIVQQERNQIDIPVWYAYFAGPWDDRLGGERVALSRRKTVVRIGQYRSVKDARIAADRMRDKKDALDAHESLDDRGGQYGSRYQLWLDDRGFTSRPTTR
jgi:hypothetical protein